jgi:hypothetical protein
MEEASGQQRRSRSLAGNGNEYRNAGTAKGDEKTSIGDYYDRTPDSHTAPLSRAGEGVISEVLRL